MSVSKKDVEHVAKLARLEFSELEKDSLISDLNNVLGYIEKLDELNTENEDIIVNPYYIENKFREDIIHPSMRVEDVEGNAPQSLEGYVVVPKIID
ncbi:MAG: Asp-tRNA(Asn)/Glu-tRNA(Gln) amidotransferase subunit GatC [Solirubrobacterales bacterium]